MRGEPNGMTSMKVGEFYLDTVNHDLLKILGFTKEHYPENMKAEEAGLPVVVPYVRCACIVNDVFFGIQEMRVSTMALPRFARVEGFWRNLRLRFKYRNSRLTNTMVGGGPPANPLEKKTY